MNTILFLGLPGLSRLGLMAAVWLAVSLAGVTQGSAQAYPNKGTMPTPMWGNQFRYQDPLSGGTFNNDGTNNNNPVVPAPTSDPVYQQYSSNYQINLLNSQSSITFKGKQYQVYSAVPKNMTINYAYNNASQYYDPASLVIPGTKTPIIEFTIPNKINNGNPTSLTGNQPPKAPQTSPYNTKEHVYLIRPPSDPNSLYFIPNLPNINNGAHNGLTANIYFVGDPFKGKAGYWPDTKVWPHGTFHLTPYGWASNPTFVAKNYDVQLLDATGGVASVDQNLFDSTAILRNFWKHTIQGYDHTYTGSNPNDPTKYTVKRDIATAMMKAIQADAHYPFPPGNYKEYLGWLTTLHNDPEHPKDPTKDYYTMNGIYFHVQPQPGFQRNLLRYYTAWGAVDIYNQASDLFIYPDGTIELPAVNTSSKPSAPNWRYAPIVTQTWDGSQRYSLLNLTSGQVPSTYDDYPGYEYYLPGNVYLPGQAGVVTAYVDYLVQDKTGLSARQTDLWLGFKGDSANDILFWADAPVANQPTEPGGQGNKPYMFGASTVFKRTNPEL